MELTLEQLREQTVANLQNLSINEDDIKDDDTDTPPVDDSDTTDDTTDTTTDKVPAKKADDVVDDPDYKPFGESIDDKGTTPPEDDLKIDEEEQKVFDKVIGEKLSPMEQELFELKTEKKIDDFLSDPKNDIFKDAKSTIKEYAKLPQVKKLNLPVESLARLAINPRALIVKGMQMEREAQAKNNRITVTSGAGSAPTQIRNGLGFKDISKMTDAEFKAFDAKVRSTA